MAEHEGMREGRGGSASLLPIDAVGDLLYRSSALEPQAQAGLAFRLDEDDVERVERVMRDDGASGLDHVVDASLERVQPLAIVHGGQEALLAPPKGLGLHLEVLGKGQRDRLRV